MINQIQQSRTVKAPSESQIRNAIRADGMRTLCSGCLNERRVSRTDTRVCRSCVQEARAVTGFSEKSMPEYEPEYEYASIRERACGLLDVELRRSWLAGVGVGLVFDSLVTVVIAWVIV